MAQQRFCGGLAAAKVGKHELRSAPTAQCQDGVPIPLPHSLDRLVVVKPSLLKGRKRVGTEHLRPLVTVSP